MADVLKTYSILILFLFVLLLTPLVTQAQIQGLQYPIPELGGCTGWNSCLSWCVVSNARYSQCIDYLERNGFLDDTQDTNRSEGGDGVPNALPVPTISVLGADSLLGTARIMVNVSGADRVRMYISEEGSNEQVSLGRAERLDANSTRWEYFFDTTRFSNGRYTLHAWADSGRYISVEGVLPIRINNVSPISASQDPLPRVIEDASTALKETTQRAERLTQDAETDVSTAFERYRNSLEDSAGDVDEDLRSALNDVEEETRSIVRDRTNLSVNTNNLNTLLKRVSELSPNKSLNQQLEDELGGVLGDLEDSLVEVDQVLRTRLGDISFEDSDGDGLSDFSETVIYKTDPNKRNTDDDEFTDDEEILNRRNPLTTDDSEIEYEDAQTTGPIVRGVFEVTDIQVVEVVKNDKGEERASKIEFRGRGLPNSIVTLYIYSSPIVVSVKTDNNGLWTYTLDQELEDGTHEIHVAIVDSTGKISAKSEPIPFVKEANAVSLDPFAFTTSDEGEPTLLTSGLVGAILLILGALFVAALVAVGVLHSRHDHGSGKGDSESGNAPPPPPAGNA